MEPHIPIGRGCALILLIFTLLTPAFAQTSALTCSPSAVPTLVRSEGVAERIGDILLQCSGGAAGAVVTGNLSLFLPVSVTNRVNADNVATDVSLVVESGSAPPATVVGRVAGQSITFNGISFTVPATGGVTLRVSNLRANASQLGAANNQRLPVQISTTLGSVLVGNPVTAAQAVPGLLATATAGGISCAASPAPSQISMTALFERGTRFASTRLTEGFADAFQKKVNGNDTGTRFVVRYSGIPSGVRLFVPDLVAGSNAAQPTSGGDLGGTQAVGQYTPGSNSLFLSRVAGTDANGAGGFLVLPPNALGGGTLTLNFASEIPSSNGTAMVVYEVVDSSAGTIESVQIPTFVAVNSTEGGIIRVALSLGPVSGAPAASTNAPIPRFAAVEPEPDCSALNDCGSDAFPRLGGDGQGLQFTSIAGGAVGQRPGHITVRNEGGGIMSWTAAVTYKNGSGWISLYPSSGVNGGSVRVFVNPQTLPPGTYEATIAIDAGLAGSRSHEVRLTVSPVPVIPDPPQPPAPKVTVSGIMNGANFLFTPLAPGSIATIKGSGFKGSQVAVTFDGAPAKLFYVSETQLNLLVPPETAGKSSAQVVVTVDGESGAPQRVSLAAVSPAIFQGGVLNQNNSVNGPGSGAPPGSVLQIFATGLPAAGVFVKIHDRDNLAPLYAGPAGFDGVQQVNVRVPDDLPAMTTSLLVCAYGPDNRPVCSHPADLVLVK